MKIAGIVLAAGSSRRLGQPKQTLRIGKKTLLQRSVRVARMADLRPIFVVTSRGLDHDLDDSAIKIVNEAAEEGIASSIRSGVAAAIEAGVDAVVILVCDQPALTEHHLRNLMMGGDEVVASCYAGRKGVPAYFPASAFGELMKLRGDSGARDLLLHVRAVEFSLGELDIDTVEDLDRARAVYPELGTGEG